jgi:hypothetical protein
MQKATLEFKKEVFNVAKDDTTKATMDLAVTTLEILSEQGKIDRKLKSQLDRQKQEEARGQKRPNTAEDYAKDMPKLTGKEPVQFNDPQRPAVPAGGKELQR